jgi:preprotein translocase subunit SecA
LSLEDDLMRIFGADRITGLMERLGMEEDVPIEAAMVNKAIANAQTKVEAMHFDTRKNLFEYDNVMNDQRKAIYALRKQILEGRYRPEILDEQARAEQGHKLPPPPSESGPHSVESLAATVRDRVTTITDEHIVALLEDGAEAETADGKSFPKAGVEPERLRHELYRHYGATVDFAEVRLSRAGVLQQGSSVIAQSLIEQRERIHDLANMVVEDLSYDLCPPDVHPDDWDVPGLEKAVSERFYTSIEIRDIPENVDDLVAGVWAKVESVLRSREEEFGLYTFLFYVRQFYLREIDEQWIAHLRNIDQLRTGIGLVGYATRDPKNEYKIRGYSLFKEMWESIEQTVLDRVLGMRLTEEQLRQAEEGAEYETSLTRALGQRSGGRRAAAQATSQGQEDRLQDAARQAMEQLSQAGAVPEPSDTAEASPGRAAVPKVRPNEPCPCGSGKRYKKCHGKA